MVHLIYFCFILLRTPSLKNASLYHDENVCAIIEKRYYNGLPFDIDDRIEYLNKLYFKIVVSNKNGTRIKTKQHKLPLLIFTEHRFPRAVDFEWGFGYKNTA